MDKIIVYTIEADVEYGDIKKSFDIHISEDKLDRCHKCKTRTNVLKKFDEKQSESLSISLSGNPAW